MTVVKSVLQFENQDSGAKPLWVYVMPIETRGEAAIRSPSPTPPLASIGADFRLWVGRDAHPHCRMAAAGVPAGHVCCEALRRPRRHQSPPFLKGDLGGFSMG